jgi:hypothetical protein
MPLPSPGSSYEYEVDFLEGCFQRNIVTGRKRDIYHDHIPVNGRSEQALVASSTLPLRRWPFRLGAAGASTQVTASPRLRFGPELRLPVDVTLKYRSGPTDVGLVRPFAYWEAELDGLEDLRGVAMERVAEGSDEFAFVSSHFRYTGGDAQAGQGLRGSRHFVHEVYRLQNPAAAEAFAVERRRIEASRLRQDRPLDERLVWHGVRSEAGVAPVARDTLRVVRSHGGLNAFGNGLYFARDFSIAVDYASTLDRREGGRAANVIFLGHLVVGDMTRGTTGLQVPIKPGTVADHFETMVNDVNDPRVFCATRDNQALLLYLVAYDNVPKQDRSLDDLQRAASSARNPPRGLGPAPAAEATTDGTGRSCGGHLWSGVLAAESCPGRLGGRSWCSFVACPGVGCSGVGRRGRSLSPGHLPCPASLGDTCRSHGVWCLLSSSFSTSAGK